jgi:hypothetical protein
MKILKKKSPKYNLFKIKMKIKNNFLNKIKKLLRFLKVRKFKKIWQQLLQIKKIIIKLMKIILKPTI